MADHKRNTEKVVLYMEPLKAAALKARAISARTSRSSMINTMLDSVDSRAISRREEALRRISAFEQSVSGLRCDLARLGNLQKQKGGSPAIFNEIRKALAELRELVVAIKHSGKEEGR